MPLVNAKDLLRHAYSNAYAVGGFDVAGLDFLAGIMRAAEKHRSPVMLNLAERRIDAFDFDLLMPAVVKAAQRASVPVAIHLDRGASLDSAIHAINQGCNSVMLDTSTQSLADNIENTAAVVRMAHGCGVPVEGGLGYVAGVEGDELQAASGANADEARQYVDATGVDFLSVSIATARVRSQANPELDISRLKELNSALGVPLVMHGDSGLSDDQFRPLIANGIARINCDSVLADTAARQLRDRIAGNATAEITGLSKGIIDAVSVETGRYMQLLGSAGQADDCLAKSESWLPVEHLIIYNVSGISGEETRSMILEGRKVLSTIPGVLEVVVGEAVKADAEYRYTWLVRFCHPAVIDSYRDHPLHVAFANNQFRPVAGGRVSIDYQTILPTST